MELTVRLFAGLRERAGASELTLEELPAELTVGALKRLLAERHPELGDLGHVAGVVGTEYASDERLLAAGDEVSLLPPVSGGAPGDGPPAEDLERGHFLISSEPLDPGALAARVVHPACGAVVTFTGTTRETNRGEDVVHLDYEAFEAMTGPEMARIFEDCRRSFADEPEPPMLRMLCAHRIGRVGVGEPSVVIAVSSPHRDAAFLAARFLIDTLKERLPVWKKEVYQGGHHWIGDRS